MMIIRNILNRLRDDLKDPRPTLLIGARQVGKTFLMHQLADEAARMGHSTAFFDLEQPSDSAALAKPDRAIVDYLNTCADVVFIDEFHYLKNASHILKAIFDSPSNTKIVASGSSAMEIHKHIKESLAGRKVIRRILPCSYLEMSQVEDFSINLYFTYGGMPGTVYLNSAANKQTLRKNGVEFHFVPFTEASIIADLILTG